MTEEWHEKHGIWVMDWPSSNSDLNPLEHVWRALKEELYEHYPNLHELKKNEAGVEIFKSRIKEVWESIDQEHIRKLVASIPARLDACQNAEGWYTRY